MSRYRRSRRSNGRRLESVSHRCSSTIIAALGDHLLSHLLIIITEVVNERRVCCATLFPQKLKTCAAACVGKRPEDSGHVSRKECGRCKMVSEVGGGGGGASGLHLPLAQDVDYNVGAHFAPDQSCRLVHAHTVDVHAVDSDNHICATSDAAADTSFASSTYRRQQARRYRQPHHQDELRASQTIP